jgi:hypothetical protein
VAHRVGNLLLPAPAPPFGPLRPDDTNTAILDPALNVLGAFFRALIEHHCAEAWSNIAPGEPLVRTLFVGYDPEELDFSGESDTPCLALWRENEGAATRLADGVAQKSTEVHVMWIAPPANEQVMAARSPFYNALSNAFLLAYANQRDPCWVRHGDEANHAARTYGSYVWGHAGIDGWTYAGLQRDPIAVPAGEGVRPHLYPAYLARWTILESTENDPAAFGSTIAGTRIGTERTAIRFDVTDMAGDDALVRQSALVPPDDP